MVARAPRFLLVTASLLQVLGGIAHTAAFHRARSAIEASNLPPLFSKSCKALWLADSTTMFILAVVFGLIAVRPSVARRPVVLLLALIPAAIAILIYVFVGNFFAGHLLLATAAAVFLAGLQFPGTRT